MNGNSSSNRNSSSATTAAVSATATASRQLLRRLNGIGQPHWSVSKDIELVQHLGDAHDLLDLDVLSDCILRMTEHVHGLGGRSSSWEPFVAKALITDQTPLYTAVAAVLQQLGQGLQQYMQQGQLPAALTERAVDACWALCSLLTFACSCSFGAKVAETEGVYRITCKVLYRIETHKGMQCAPAVSSIKGCSKHTLQAQCNRCCTEQTDAGCYCYS
jgi:hypothetical protein